VFEVRRWFCLFGLDVPFIFATGSIVDVAYLPAAIMKRAKSNAARQQDTTTGKLDDFLVRMPATRQWAQEEGSKPVHRKKAASQSTSLKVSACRWRSKKANYIVFAMHLARREAGCMWDNQINSPHL